MSSTYLKTSLVLCLLLLFGAVFVLFSMDHKYPTYQNTQEIVSLSQDSKAKLTYEINSDQMLGVLLKTNNPDEAEKVLRSKGATTSRHNIGRVIAANIPQNQISSLENENSIQAILPNRVVKAFSIDEVSQTNPENFWNSGFKGKGIKIAVLDTGINNIQGQDFTGSGTTDDENGHGTKVSEIISAMAPESQLLNVKVLDKNGEGTEASVIAGINYAVDNNANIISLSLGGFFSDINSPLVSAVEDAINKGVTVVVASGNCRKQGLCGDFTGVATPGNSPNSITVGSVDGENQVDYSSGQDFGNYIKPDVVAPVSADSLTGTSASTPFVSGAAALIIQKYKSSPSQVKSLIEKNAKDLGIPGKDTVFGSGKLNLDFLTETPVENKIDFAQTTAPIITNRVIHAATSGATSSAGDWSIFDLIGLQVHAIKLKSDFYNPTNGFVYDGHYALATDGNTISNVYYLPFNANSDCYSSGTNDIKVTSTNKAYAVGYEVIDVFNGTAWNTEPLPIHQQYTTLGGSHFNFGYNLQTVDANQGAVTVFAGGTNNTNTGSSGCPVNPIGGIILKKNGGSWTLESQSFLPIKDIEFVSSSLAFAAGSTNNAGIVNQTIYKWDGTTWTVDKSISSSTRGEINKIYVLNSSLGFAVGDKGTIMKWDGIAWNDFTSPVQVDLFGVNLYNSTFGYAVGANSTILKYDGTTWAMQFENGVFLSPRICDINASGTSSCGNGYVGNWREITNTTFYDVHVFSPINGILLGGGSDVNPYSGNIFKDSVEFKLQPSAPKLNVPMLTTEQNTPLNADLTLYSDGQSFNVTGSCSLIGLSQLKINPSPGFIGLMTCQITATKDGLTTSQTVPISVVPSGPVSDLEIDSSDMMINSTKDVVVTVHNIGLSVANNVNVKLIETHDNKILQNITGIINPINNKSSATQTFSFSNDMQRGSIITAVVDYDNSIVEYSESNNRAETSYKKLDAYLNIQVEQMSLTPIVKYLRNNLNSYNIVNDPTNAQVIINAGYNLGDTNLGCKYGSTYANGRIVNDVHTGLIFATQDNGKTIVNVCGARIEGLINALKRLNKQDVAKNKETFFDRDDLGAISIRDFFANGNPVNTDNIDIALNGPLVPEDKYVFTSDGTTLLRLKHYKPAVSQSFLDYLLGVDNSKPWLEPVVMAGGLWSDISAWDKAGREIASGYEDGYFTQSIKYAPRDVWLIELTGGPGTDCDTCADYTYEDVVDKYWPALVGGVLKLTNKQQTAYVGHSNGGRVALDAMKNYSVIRSTYPIAGKLSDGTTYSLPASNPINNFIGVGVPGAFSSPTEFTQQIINGNGDSAINILQTQGDNHPKLSEFAAKLRTPIGLFAAFATGFENNKISLNNIKAYVNLVNSITDVQPGSGFTVPKATIIYGDYDFGNSLYDSDTIVPVSDANAIYSNIGSPDKIKIAVHTVHWGQTEDLTVKTKIKERLNQ